ncbi:MAG TPA: DUF1996 domain-containing protein [Pilimelia sp.]|nr:DUF1996 domain-containing protein [Pilimelia sp.]
MKLRHQPRARGSGLVRRAAAVLPVVLAAAIAGVVHQAGAATAPAVADPHAGHRMTTNAAQTAAILAQQAAPLRGSEFRADCTFSHLGDNDPIVKPGQTGASHRHQFFGNRTTDANSTQSSLLAGGTTCNPTTDKVPYWVPALYKNGVHIPPESIIVYYQGITNPTTARAFPPGFKMVVGNALATSPDQNPSARWNCAPLPEAYRDFPNCPAGTKLQTYLDFPTCWDGVRLDSPNHISHMAWSVGGLGTGCPSTHPVAVPRVQFVITYNVNGGGLTLGGTRNGVNVLTAPGYTFHGDFWNAWVQPELERRVRDCINAGYICGNDGYPIGGNPPPAPPPPPPPPPPPGPPPPPPPPGRDAYGTIQAESYNAQAGVSLQTTTDAGGGQNITSVSNGDWVVYNGVNFGSTPARQFLARVASGASGFSGLVEVRLDSRTAPVAGSFAIGNTGGWQSWQTVPANISNITGTHNVYITFASGQPAAFVNVNWLTFAR